MPTPTGLVTGDPACTSGLSKRIHDNLLAGASGAIEGDALKAFSFAIAKSIVDEFQANAMVQLGAAGLTANITTQSCGKTPNPNNPDTAIVGPGTLVPTEIPLAGVASVQ